MKKLRKRYVLSLLLVCILCLFGCTRTKIIDKISIIHVFGFDLAENGDLIGSVLIPDYTATKGTEKIQYLEDQAPTAVLFSPKMAQHTSTPVNLAKIRVLVFGKEYAEAGIEDMVERFILTPQLGTNIQIAVSTHSAKETLNIFKKEKSLTLAERLKHNMQGQSLPNMALHDFLNHFYGEGMDAYVPTLTIDENNRVQVKGIGIFKKDKLKLELTPEQTTIFSYIKDKRTQATYSFALDEKDMSENITVQAFNSKSNWDWNQKKQELNLRLQLQLTLLQFPERFDVEKTENITKLRKLVESRLVRDIRDLMDTFKENEVDPIGIGNIVRSQDRTWKSESFYEQYPNMPIHVNLDVQVLHSGLEG